jgi:hypothetical protein
MAKRPPPSQRLWLKASRRNGYGAYFLCSIRHRPSLACPATGLASFQGMRRLRPWSAGSRRSRRQRPRTGRMASIGPRSSLAFCACWLKVLPPQPR